MRRPELDSSLPMLCDLFGAEATQEQLRKHPLALVPGPPLNEDAQHVVEYYMFDMRFGLDWACDE